MANIAHAPRLPSRRRNLLWTVGEVLAAIIVLVGVLALTGTLTRLVDAVTGRSTATSYVTSTVTRGNLAINVVATGPIAAPVNVPLSFKGSGKLATLRANVGDRVASGQVLATLDQSDLENSLKQAQANLDQAMASLHKIQAGPSASQITVARTSLVNAKRSGDEAQAALSTARQSTARDLVAAQTSVDSSATSLTTALTGVSAAQDQRDKGLAADQTALDNAQKNLNLVNAYVAANQKVLLQQLAKAKDDLYAAQLSRDAACARPGSQCDTQNAQVFSSETALNLAQAQLNQSQVQAQQQLAQAQTQLDQAKSQAATDKSKLDAAVVSAQNQVKQAQAGLSSSRAALEQAKIKSTQTVQSAQSQVTQATNSVDSAQAGYNQTVAPPLPSDVAAAKAQVANAQAGEDAARANLDAATLAAPFDGTVAAINGSIQQWVTGGAPGNATTNSGTSASATAIMTLVDLNALQVTVQVNEADIGKIKVGNPVTFSVSAYPNKTFSGKVLTIQPVGTTVQNVVNYNVTSSIQTTEGAILYPGMTATATIVVDSRQSAVLIPNTALSFGQAALRDKLVSLPTPSAGGAGSRQGSSGQTGATRGVVVAQVGSNLLVRSVTLGITDGTQTEVLSGVNPGDVLVVGQSSGASASSTGGTRTPSGIPLGVGRGG